MAPDPSLDPTSDVLQPQPAPDRLPEIHPSAVVDPAAELGPGVTVEAHAVIGPEVRLGAGVRVGANVVLSGALQIAAETRIWPGAVLGGEPQMHSYREGGTAVIGARCQLREFASVHRGSEEGHTTVVGDGVMMMASSHVAHDCIIEDGVVLTNGALVAGHVSIGERAILSGNVLVHQFARIGTRAIISGGGRVSRDVPPYAMMKADATVVGINWVGLRRGGVSREAQREIREVYRAIYSPGTTLERAVESAAALAASPEARKIIEFLRAPSKRGFCTGRLERERT